MNILALDTSTDACSAALLIDGHVTEKFIVAPQQHSQLILPMLNKLLATAEIKLNTIDAFAFGRGPGSFTGLRIAASIIQAVAFVTDRPVVPISTLQAMATGWAKEHCNPLTINKNAGILVCLDARMQEVYYAGFIQDSDNAWAILDTERVCPPEAVKLPTDNNTWYGVGNGWSSYAEQLPALQYITPNIYPQARYIATLAAVAYQKGEMVSAEQAIPTYLRDDVARKNL